MQAAIVFALLISPGYLLLQGYRRSRSYTLPDKDLYVVAQSVVASLAWLSWVWLALLPLGDPVDHWGLVPQNGALLERHRATVAALFVGLEFGPFIIGVVAGRIVNLLHGTEQARRILSWTGLFEAPTAWDHAWNQAAARATAPGGAPTIDVRICLRTGGVVEGRYGAGSRADLSPRVNHQVFLETAYGVDDSSGERRLLGDGTIGGVYIDASEITSIYFKS